MAGNGFAFVSHVGDVCGAALAGAVPQLVGQAQEIAQVLLHQRELELGREIPAQHFGDLRLDEP